MTLNLPLKYGYIERGGMAGPIALVDVTVDHNVFAF